MNLSTICVAGGGAWGTALAHASAVGGRTVTLWLRDPAAAAELRSSRRHPSLPDILLHPGVAPTSVLGDLAECGVVLLATPAQATGEMAARLAAALPPEVPLVLCAKGIERTSGRFLTEVAAGARPGSPVAVLSGPSFAADVARGLPTAVALASSDEALAGRLAAALSGPGLRVYSNGDPRGTEIGGAAKNVLAIACGAAIGRGLGESARAALMARGFAELLRFAAACGGRPETLMGLSGLGDVVLSCGSARSRNFRFGERLGRGMPPDEAAGGELAEGAHTAEVLVRLTRARGVEMPVAEAVEGVVAGRLGLAAAIDGLLARPLRAEV